MNPENNQKFLHFHRRLLIGTLVLDGILLSACYTFWPGSLRFLLAGMGMGFLYLLSLGWSARFPVQTFQFAFSLTRTALLAYLIVKIANFRVQETMIVICGLLSYKCILLVDAVYQIVKQPRRGSHTPSKLSSESEIKGTLRKD